MGFNPLSEARQLAKHAERMARKTAYGAIEKVERFVDDPVGETINTAMQPVRDGVEVFRGLTEGQLRVKAAARLGADYVSGMALGELIEWATDNLD